MKNMVFHRCVSYRKKVKYELSNCLRENVEVKETDRSTINIENVIPPGEAIALINRYEEIIKTQHKIVMAYIARLEKILKKFKDVKNSFENVEDRVDLHSITN